MPGRDRERRAFRQSSGNWIVGSQRKIWVKGVMISGMVTRSAPSFGVRVKFSQAELSEKEHLREFLKFVENSARKSQSEKPT